VAEEISVEEKKFAVVRLDGNRRFSNPRILTTCETIEELAKHYTTFIALESRRSRGNVYPIGFSDGLPVVLDKVIYDTLELTKKQARERLV